jgi:hypothetical protein
MSGRSGNHDRRRCPHGNFRRGESRHGETGPSQIRLVARAAKEVGHPLLW